jgi:hypothetical protein
LGDESPLGESRSGTPEGVLPPPIQGGGSAATAVAEVEVHAYRRSASFFLFSVLRLFLNLPRPIVMHPADPLPDSI